VIAELPLAIVQARIKLMLGEPYLATAIARFPVVNASDMDWCQTMATDGYNIYVNPEFCNDLSSEEIGFVFAHEILHCVLGHIDRRGDRKEFIWNMAIDYATNIMLVEFGLKMPPNGLWDNLYRGMTAEDIYSKLLEKMDSDVENGDQTQWDIHLSPNDIRGSSARKQDFPTIEERVRIRMTLTQAMKEKFRGLAAGFCHDEITKAHGPKVCWQTLTAKFFSGLRRDNYRLLPPNKKHIWRGIYLPSLGFPGPSHIVVAIDTSGSMSDLELGQILAELDKLRSSTECRLTIIQCDADIRKIEEIDEFTQTSFARYTFFGRGGTRFEPVFDWIRDRASQTPFFLDALIYLTDGFGSFPRKAPPYPVLWILTSQKKIKMPFGEAIYLKD
jgi:predicted metal-dependent peptidase